MNSRNNQEAFQRIFVLACFLSISNAVLADDWEIYTGNSTISGTVKPNIVLLMDTSSSMRDSNVTLPLTDYDASFEYPSTDINGNSCRTDVIYYIIRHNNSNSTPSEVFEEISDSEGCSTLNYIPIESLTCQAAVNDLNKRGYYYGDYMAQYDKDESTPDWEDVTGSHDTDAWVECRDDAGIHGKPASNASITWTRRDSDGNEVYDVNGDPIFEVTITVPDMASGDAYTYIDKGDPPVNAANPWAKPGSGFEYPASLWEAGDSYAEEDMLLINPNYMRYLFSSGDHDNDVTTPDVRFAEPIVKRRIEVLQDVMTDLLNTWNGIRVSVIRYNDHHGSSVTIPALDIDCLDSDPNCDPSPNDGVTNRQLMLQAIEYWKDTNGDGDGDDPGEYDRVSGGTPHTEAIYEAYNYLRGGPVEWGYVRRSSSSTKDFLLTNRAATWEGRGFEADGLDEKTYLSPIQYDCQSNFIVHMTDGGSSWDGGYEPSSYYHINTDTDGRDPYMKLNDGSGTTYDVDDAIKSLPDFDTLTDHSCSFDPDSNVWDGIDGVAPSSGSVSGDWDSCADELTEYMATLPQELTVLTTEGNKVTIKEPKPIKTYVIGFGEDNDFLNTMGTKGLGGYYTAKERGDLKEAFADAITNILNSGTATISAPGVAVESFSRARHLDDLYFNLFQYNSKPLYDGNLKKFKLSVDSDGNPFIRDQQDRNVIQADGSFLSDSKSFWSAAADGNNVPAGGAASKLPATRNIHTWITGNTDLLNHSVNLVHESNAAGIPTGAGGLDLPASESTDLSVTEAGEWKTKYLKFARGLDSFNADPALVDLPRNQMGDPLHSVPVVAIYDANQADLSNPEAIIFTMDNEGYLHAIDIKTGVEEWAFMPQQLLKNIRDSKINNGSPTKIYGLDGYITLDEEIGFGDEYKLESGVSGDFAHIYFGMRRGGRNYYSLDVTDRSNPKHRWEIVGGSGDFDRLGESWSKIYTGKVMIGTAEKKVLFFTGGYDSGTYDEKPKVLDEANMGNAIYMVDASNGQILWTADNQARAVAPTGAEDYDNFNDMDYAFPADPAVVDMNSDGYMDRIYAVDISGQLWRFDIHNSQTGSDLVTGGKILDTEGATGAEKRHFFNQPDVVLVNDRLRGRFVSINFGSGNRDKPGNTEVPDMFISFRDPNSAVASVTSYLAAKPLTDLKDVTVWEDDDTSTTTNEEEDFVNDIFTKQGWYFSLPNTGEKNLSAAVTINGEVLFTTYQPPTSTSAIGCMVNLGTARLYTVSVKTGAATQDLNTITTGIDKDGDRSTEIAYQGIPPGVVVLFPMSTGGKALGLVGTDLVDPNIPNHLRRAYWYIKGREPGK